MDNLKDAMRQSRVYWLALIAMAVIALLPAPSRIPPRPHGPQVVSPALPSHTAQMETME